MAFAAMFVAGLFLVGCGSDGDSGMMGPAGPPGDAPTAEEVAEALLADDDAVDMLTGPAGDTGADAGVQDVVDTLAMTPAERIMASLGGTAPKGSKADEAKAQADLIAGLKEESATPVWYNARKIINLYEGDMVEGAIGLHLGDVGAELAHRGTDPNPGPDGVVEPGTVSGGVMASYGIAELFERLNDKRAGEDQMNAMDAIDNLPKDPAPDGDALFNAYFEVIADPMRLDLSTPDDPTDMAETAEVTWEDINDVLNDVSGHDVFIDSTLRFYWRDVFEKSLVFNALGTEVTGADLDGDGKTDLTFDTAGLNAALGGASLTFANSRVSAGLPAATVSGDLVDYNVLDTPTPAEVSRRQAEQFILRALLKNGLTARAKTALTGTPPGAPVGSTADNYPAEKDSDYEVMRKHLDTLTLVPVVDVDGVSLVKYTIDSAIGTTGTPPVPDKDGHYRLEAYGAWLEDSYFGVHIYSAVTDYGTSLVDAEHGKSTAVHFAGGSPASLAGLNENAMWTGAMVGHDTKSTADDTRVQGNAMLNARIQADSLAAPGPGGVAVMDVMFDNITDAAGMDARVTELSWSGLELQERYYSPLAGSTIPAGFIKSNGEIEGWLFNDGNEVVGKFNHMDIVGAYGATLDDGMMDDMAGN